MVVQSARTTAKSTGSRPTRVVVTGVGVVSAAGVGRQALWSNLMAGRSGIGPLKSIPTSQLPCKLAAEIEGFEAAHFLRNRKLQKVMSRDIELGVGAAALATEDARLRVGEVDPDRLGVVFGAGRISPTPHELVRAAASCSRDASFEFERFDEEAMAHIYPLWLLPQLPNMPACHVAIEHDARGPNNTITSREASALLALAEGLHAIRRGVADQMIVGACGSELNPHDVARLSLGPDLTRHADPTRCHGPFDLFRDGWVLGEGAAAFVIESYESAVRRGAEIYAEVLGVAGGADGAGAENARQGIGLVRAISAAMRQAGIEPGELGHINADGKATLKDDWIEARAYHQALGSAAERIPVTGLKSYFGTFDAGSGAVELAATLLALKEGRVPGTLNYVTPDPLCRLNVIANEPARLNSSLALKVNRTAMGQSVAAVLRG